MGGYGILDDSSKAEMQKAAVRYEQEEAAFTASAEELTPAAPELPRETPGKAPSPPTDIVRSPEEKAEGTQGNTLQRRFLVCPKCGEKIWL